MSVNKLPTVKTRKLISKEKFEKLAKKVREHFEKEKEYIKSDNGNKDSNGTIIYT